MLTLKTPARDRRLPDEEHTVGERYWRRMLRRAKVPLGNAYSGEEVAAMVEVVRCPYPPGESAWNRHAQLVFFLQKATKGLRIVDERRRPWEWETIKEEVKTP